MKIITVINIQRYTGILLDTKTFANIDDQTTEGYDQAVKYFMNMILKLEPDSNNDRITQAIKVGRFDSNIEQLYIVNSYIENIQI